MGMTGAREKRLQRFKPWLQKVSETREHVAELESLQGSSRMPCRLV